MSNEERKEVLRCLIDQIVVGVSDERIDARIRWKAGGKTRSSSSDEAGHHHLLRELHVQNLTAVEIKQHLAAGKTSTGQAVTIGFNRLYFIMHKMGLKQHRFSLAYLSVQQKAAELYREGRSTEWIAKHFKEQGYASASGKPWTAVMVNGVLRAIGEKPDSLEEIQRRLIEMPFAGSRL